MPTSTKPASTLRCELIIRNELLNQDRGSGCQTQDFTNYLAYTRLCAFCFHYDDNIYLKFISYSAILIAGSPSLTILSQSGFLDDNATLSNIFLPSCSYCVVKVSSTDSPPTSLHSNTCIMEIFGLKSVFAYLPAV